MRRQNVVNKSNSQQNPQSDMEVTKTLKPGDRGTAKLLRPYGERLVRARHRFDPTRKKNLTTVELVVDERDAPEGYHPLSPRRPEPKQQVLVRVDIDETQMRARVKDAHGRWDPERRGWLLPYATVREMGLEDRIMQEYVPRSSHAPALRG